MAFLSFVKRGASSLGVGGGGCLNGEAWGAACVHETCPARTSYGEFGELTNGKLSE